MTFHTRDDRLAFAEGDKVEEVEEAPIPLNQIPILLCRNFCPSRA